MTEKNPEDIRNYAAKLRRIKTKLAGIGQGTAAIRFLDTLKPAGKRNGRLAYRADRLAPILPMFETKFDAPVPLGDAAKADCE